ncbi:MAG: peptidoglycan/LPS O-acetylase OafA/YrhL [Cyclobacteriaceae bacterium]|jgi:peptidoglycan/LPS O-acetylase OafA/YrhL
MKQTTTRYFPGLQALRFFAAFLVVFHHIEQYKFWSNKESAWGIPITDALGHAPVSLFFVLSGFLITFLLLDEKKRTGAINIGLFYFKRILRIWPLYLLVAVVSLFIIPLFSSISFPEMFAPDILQVFALLLFMLPNLLRITFPHFLGANQLWSVGIEEQFYLIWPWLINAFHKKILAFMLFFIAGKLLLHLGLNLVIQHSGLELLISFEKLFSLFQVEQMAIGGLGAYVVFNKITKVKALLTSPITLFCTIVALIAVYSNSHHYLLRSNIEGVLLLVIICQVTFRKQIWRHLESKTLVFLGNLSYGIYMWHTIAITISITVLDVSGFYNSNLLTGLTLVITFGLSAASYRWIEKPVLKLKKHYPQITERKVTTSQLQHA